MANTKKLTKRDHFKSLLTIPAVSANQTLVDFINHELELLDKKNAAPSKPSANQVANENFKTAILNGMTENRLYTITELTKAIPAIADLANQRVTAIVRQMVTEGSIVRTEDKRKAYFSLAPVVEVED